MATRLVGHLEKVRALAAKGALLAVGGVRAGPRSLLTLFDTATGKSLRSIDVPSHVLCLAFAGDRLVAGCADGMLRVYDPATGGAGPEAVAHAGGCLALAAPAGIPAIATAGADGVARLWTLGAGLAPDRAFPLSAQPLRAVALDGVRLAAAGDDGVVRVVPLVGGPQRDMPGHAGPVHALAFTPRDGRLASAGDDGTLRLWFLDGAVEAEVRGANEQGHAGGAFALLFGPVPAAGPAVDDVPDRLFSAGADAKVKVWRLDERRKPRTYDLLDAVRALALVAPPAGAKDPGLGTVVAGGDGRALLFIPIGADGKPADAVETGEHGFRLLEQAASGNQQPGRLAAARALAALEEPEALALLQKMLAADRDAGVRALAAELLGRHGRRDARPALRERLDDGHDKVRAAALAALVALEAPNPVVALRAGLGSRYPDVRRAAVAQLPALYPASPLVPSLVQGALTDADAAVREAALAALVQLHRDAPFEALRIAFERGTPDVRIQAMVRGLLLGDAHREGLTWMSGRALDDDDADVRRAGLTVHVLGRRTLAAVLQARSGDFRRLLAEVLRRVALLRRSAPGKEVAEAELAEAYGALGLPPEAAPEALTDADVAPLLAAIACRASDIALLGTVALLCIAEDPRAIGALLQLSRDANPSIRAAVARVLGLLQAPEAEQRLVAMLEDPDGNTRAAAVDAWTARAKERPLELARTLLGSAYEDVRARGLSALLQRERSPESEALLEQALEDEAAKVRAEAFRTLWAWEQDRPEEALDRTLAARFPDLRTRAVEELSAAARVPRDADAPPPRDPPAWAVSRLEAAVADRDGGVGLAALEAVRRLAGGDAPRAAALGLESPAVEVRRAAAGLAAKVRREHGEALRPALMKALQDDDVPVRLLALEALDALLPADDGALSAGLLSDRREVMVRAGELLARRRSELVIEPLRAFLLDKDLAKLVPPDTLQPLRHRAASALATLGSPRTIPLFATALLRDEHPGVREQAARGLCTAAEPGAAGPLLDALGHPDVAVRSWAAEGLARLGDPRGLPALVGTLRDPHVPLREGAIRALVALGERGQAGLVAGLDDPEPRIQETFLSVLLARDWKAFRRGEPPRALTAALSSQRAEIRFAAARGLELRTGAESYADYLVELLSPHAPEKASETKDWPPEAERARLMAALAEALAADTPADRYAAAQALLLRDRPLEYFAEVKRVTRLKAADATMVPDTEPRAPVSRGKQLKGWLRAIFAGKETSAAKPGEARELRWLAFGAYVGILREASAEVQGHRVRRDAIDRVVALGLSGEPPVVAAVPPLVRALDDPDHLVRRQARAGLQKLLAGEPKGPDLALRHALGSAAADVANAALDELAARGEAGKAQVAAMLGASLPEVRKHAFELLVRLSPPGSLEPPLAAFSCQHADLRLGVVERLAASTDPRVTAALVRALESEHEDLRLRAAELLADRKDDRAVPVLASLLRSEDAKAAGRARAALVRLGSAAAVRALGARLDEVATGDARRELVAALQEAGSAEGADALLRCVANPESEVDLAAFEAGMSVGRFWRPDPEDPEADRTRARATPRDGATLVRFFAAAVKSKRPEVRLAAAERMDVGDEPELDGLLVSLFADRDAAVRVQAVTRYAARVERRGAAAGPLEEVLRVGARELMLPAAEGLAHRRGPAAFRPLLLFVRAGAEGERERALRALGTQGDPRALEEMETIASGGTPEVPFDASMQAAALEGLGRLWPHLADPAQRARVWERVEAAAMDGPLQGAAILALRAMGGGKARARLEALAAGGDEGARLPAIDALGTLGDPAAEAALAACLRAPSAAVRARARRALDRLFAAEPMRVALLAARSPHGDVAGPAVEFLVERAEPEKLLALLAGPLDETLRESLRVGLVRRGALPTPALLPLVAAPRPAAREDVAWILAMHALSATGLAAEERRERARALARAALATAERWARILPADRPAEERAWRRLLWAAVVNEAPEAVAAARAALVPATGAPPAIRREAVRALARAGGRDAAAALAEAAQDRDAGVRRATVAGLARLDPAKARGLIGAVRPLDASAFAALAGPQLLATEPGRQVALPPLIARGEAGPLMELVQGRASDAEKLSALAALGRMGGVDVVEFLASLAFTGPRREAAEDEGEEDEGLESEDGGEGDEDGDGEGEGEAGSADVTPAGARRFEFVEGTSSKFWEVVVEGSVLVVRFGRIGTAGQTKTKTFPSPEAARKELDKLVREKTGKGYEEKPPRGRRPLVSVAAARPAPAARATGSKPWGTEELRKAAFRAYKRALRVTERRAGAPTWFSPAELEALAEKAAAGALPIAAPPGAGGEADFSGVDAAEDEGGEDELEDDEEGADEE